MERKDSIDAFGAISLIGFSALFGFNQVVIKVLNDGFQPIFSAGLRSLGAAILIPLFIWVAGRRLKLRKESAPWGLLLGLFFSFEFLCLYIALDLTTVSRVTVLFYTMPVWMALLSHFLLPNSRLTRMKVAGLALAVLGILVAFSGRAGGFAGGDLTGDLLALAASFGWAGIAIVASGTSLKEDRPEIQLFWQVAVSAVILLALAPLFGPFIRDLQPIHIAGMAFQIVVIASFGFMLWFWLLSIYPPASVASFGFLAPIFGVGFGWLIMGDELSPSIIGSLALVCLGLVLINRPMPAQVPQKV